MPDEEMMVGDLDMSEQPDEEQDGDADIQNVAAILIDLQVILCWLLCTYGKGLCRLQKESIPDACRCLSCNQSLCYCCLAAWLIG